MSAKPMEYLRHNGKISIQRAMKLLDVSESTVRRMFRRLEEAQQVLHIYGGIQLISQNVLDYSFEKVESHQIEEKIRIARQAVALLRNGGYGVSGFWYHYGAICFCTSRLYS